MEAHRSARAARARSNSQLGAYPIDLPALHLGRKILAQHLQPRDQLIADIDVGNLQRALGERDARYRFF